MIQTIISNGPWLGAGAANAGNSGFNALAASVFDIDENGEKMITTAGANTALSSRIDAPAAVFAAGETRYRAEWTILAEYTGASNSTAITPAGTAVMNIAGAGPVASAMFAGIADATGYGLTLNLVASNGASVGASIAGLTSTPVIPVNRKTVVAISVDRTSGVVAFLVNGVRVATWTAAAPAAWDSTVELALPATVGVRWRVYGATSYTGIDPPTARHRPLFESRDALLMSLAHTATDGGDGTAWSYTGNVSLTAFTPVSGPIPGRRRMIGGAGGTTATTNQPIGDIVFNRWGDSALATTLLVPGGGSASIALRDDGDGLELIRMSVSGGFLRDDRGDVVTASDGTPAAIDPAKRYGLLINLNKSGPVFWTLFDLTSALTARAAWSNILPRPWRVDGLGKALLSVSQNAEIDRLDLGPWMALPVGDFGDQYNDGSTPVMASTVNSLGAGFPVTDAACGVPGAGWPGREFGQPRESWLIAATRATATRSAWATHVRPYLTHTRALRILAIDGGGATQDLKAGATAEQIIQTFEEDLAWCWRQNGELVISTQPPRPLGLGSSLTAAQHRERLKLNVLLAAFVRKNATNGRLAMADTRRTYPQPILSTDGERPTTGNAPAVANAIAAARRLAAAWAGGTRVSFK